MGYRAHTLPLSSLPEANQRIMELRDVYTMDAAPDILWRICVERRLENQANISFKMPTYEEHCQFIEDVPYAYWELIHEDRYHGYVSLTWRNEIGIVLFKVSRGKGIGKRALQLFMDTHDPLLPEPSVRNGNFLANINPDNERSIRLFTDLGFKLKQHTYEKT